MKKLGNSENGIYHVIQDTAFMLELPSHAVIDVKSDVAGDRTVYLTPCAETVTEVKRGNTGLA
jgi:hypothetical protein